MVVTISTTPVLIYDINPNRIDVVVTNNSSTTCYIGPNNQITAGGTIYLNQNDVWIDDYSGIKGYRGQLWGVTSSGTSTIVWWERYQ
jgi:hypothetical protein